MRTHKDLVDADWVFNFDAGGPSIDHGKLAWIELQGSEKVYWTVTLAAHNAGGHSSLPRADNAVYELVNALRGLEALNFPIDLTEVARAQLTARSQFVTAAEAELIREALKQPLDSNSAYRLARFSASYNALLRTTCIPTMLAGGHAENALPALATATVNCRLIPGENSADVMRQLRRAVADTGIAIAEVHPAKPSPPSPLLAERLALVKAACTRGLGPRRADFAGAGKRRHRWPLFPQRGHSRVRRHRAFAMPVGEERMHGKDERIPVKSFRDGVAFATALMKATAGIARGKK